MTEERSGDDFLRVDIETSPGFEPSPRVAAAIEELQAALEEEFDPEVSGYWSFGVMNPGGVRAAPTVGGSGSFSFGFDTRTKLIDTDLSEY